MTPLAAITHLVTIPRKNNHFSKQEIWETLAGRGRRSFCPKIVGEAFQRMFSTLASYMQLDYSKVVISHFLINVSFIDRKKYPLSKAIFFKNWELLQL